MIKPSKTKRFLFIVLMMTIVAWLLTDSFKEDLTLYYALAVAVMLLGLFIRTTTEKNESAIESALDQFYETLDGDDYFGRYGAVIASNKVTSSDKKSLHVTQLCQTIGGSWFTLDFCTKNGSGEINGFEAEPITASRAAVLATQWRP